MAGILVVDDEPSARSTLALLLKTRGHRVSEASGLREAARVLREEAVDVVVTDLRMPDGDGLEVVRTAKAQAPEVEVIVLTAYATWESAKEAMRLGAFDYFQKGRDPEELLHRIDQALSKAILHRENARLRQQVEEPPGLPGLLGRSAPMQRVIELVSQVAQTDATVLIQGESGTGKEVVARAVHRASPRAAGPVVAVNLAALPDTLLESELFGHERGAFTGAHQRRLGKFELADRGTLFLDEVASLRIDLQAKLLRALQERTIERLGGIRSIQVDVRIVAATNQDLKQAVRAGTFREDLYYRLDVVRIDLPPLRDRLEDIPLLVAHFVEKYTQRFGKALREVSPEALGVLMAYAWPGNVRELENIIERSVALARGPVIQLRDLPVDLTMQAGTGGGAPRPVPPLREALDRIERTLVLRALETNGWNQVRAAEQLGIHRNTLLAKLAAWGIQRPTSPSNPPARR